MIIHQLRYWKLMRRVDAQDGIVPELRFDYRSHGIVSSHLSNYVYAARFARDKMTLDLGCGSGYGSLFLAKRIGQGKAVGLDVSAAALQYCRAVRRHPRLCFLRGGDTHCPLLRRPLTW